MAWTNACVITVEECVFTRNFVEADSHVRMDGDGTISIFAATIKQDSILGHRH